MHDLGGGDDSRCGREEATVTRPVQDELPLFAETPAVQPREKPKKRRTKQSDRRQAADEPSAGCDTGVSPVVPAPAPPQHRPDACVTVEPTPILSATSAAEPIPAEPTVESEPVVEVLQEIPAFPQVSKITLPANSLLPHPERALVVSIHDVSPYTRPAVERILAQLEALGVCQVSLLVVLDHHRRGHMFDDPEFCFWLQRRVARGDEPVIHGFFHVRDQRLSESFREKVVTRVYTKGEGEFFDVAGADALRIVNEARVEFRKLGFNPRGFIAPAWLLSEGAELALRTLEFDYTTRLGTVEDFARNQVYHSQSLVWSVRSAWRRMVSRWWNALLFRRLEKNGLMRIGIHPPDIEHPAVWRQILQLTQRALADRTPVSYQSWIETSRGPAHVLQS